MAKIGRPRIPCKRHLVSVAIGLRPEIRDQVAAQAARLGLPAGALIRIWVMERLEAQDGQKKPMEEPAA